MKVRTRLAKLFEHDVRNVRTFFVGPLEITDGRGCISVWFFGLLCVHIDWWDGYVHLSWKPC